MYTFKQPQMSNMAGGDIHGSSDSIYIYIIFGSLAYESTFLYSTDRQQEAQQWDVLDNNYYPVWVRHPKVIFDTYCGLSEVLTEEAEITAHVHVAHRCKSFALWSSFIWS